MNIKPLLSSIMLSATVIAIAGCTTNSANTNSVNENTNTVVANSNENTNTEQVSEVDTSDWLTYTNEKYGFSFKYPSNWILNDHQKSINLYSQELVGSTYNNSLTIEVTENDFDSQKKQVENSDVIDGNVSLAKFNDDVEELNINSLRAKVGTHSTAIGLDEKYYFISLSDNLALYFEFLKPTDKVNTSIEDVINTLEVL